MSFDVASLFTKVLIADGIGLVFCNMNTKIACLVELCLISNFFSFQGVIYEKVDVVALVSPLFLVINNILMENFEHVSNFSSPLKSKWWKRYADILMYVIPMVETRFMNSCPTPTTFPLPPLSPWSLKQMVKSHSLMCYSLRNLMSPFLIESSIKPPTPNFTSIIFCSTTLSRK